MSAVEAIVANMTAVQTVLPPATPEEEDDEQEED